MALGPGLQLRTAQTLVMSQQLQAAIKLLALSNVELEAAIAEEMARNPLLEMRPSEGAGEEGVVVREDRETGDEAADPAGADQLGGQGEEALDRDWREDATELDSGSDLGTGSDEGFDFERVSERESGLAEHLLEQLRGTGGTLGGLAEAIVRELEETGYLETPLAVIAEELGASLKEAEAALALVQSLDPPGIAARSLEECIALQAKAADRHDPAMARLIANLDLLAKGRMADLKRICGVDDEDLADMVAELRGYDPKPGCRFAPEDAPAAAEPDVLVRQTKSGWSVELNPATLPRVLVNRRYHTELKRSASDKASRAWLSERLASAGWLVRALDQRAQTVTKVAAEIVKRQQAFFERGVAALRPLTLREVAEAIGMHESTVSRVTQNKTLLCERGLIELKYFFGSGVASDSGEGAAAPAVKAEIRRLIEGETEILSDDAIAGLLKAKGFDIARRTVVKYREAMGIGSSVQRRRQRKMKGG
ncbi:MAG TPA: RNA polymerase factor sigma-54 [Beijerinckiaceae bacterium]|nr:RNA polymerase factor sigma-54 [Beijerinckiaceae bacterium]